MSETPPVLLPDTGAWRAVTPEGDEAVAAVAADPSGVLLCCDFDGTLAPIVPNPADSRMEERSRAALDALGTRLGQLAVITGRAVEVVRELARFDEPGFGRLVVLGQYGQERWDAATGEVLLPPVPEAVAQARAELQQLLTTSDAPVELGGVALEDKGRAIGVHTRRAEQPDAALKWLAPRVAGVAERHGLSVEPGRQVVEVRSSSMTKGDALLALVDQLSPRIVLMCGDDLGDLAAFAAVDELRGRGTTGVRVVSASAEQPRVAEQADVLCGGTTGVAAFLEDLVRATEPTPRGGGQQ